MPDGGREVKEVFFSYKVRAPSNEINSREARRKRCSFNLLRRENPHLLLAFVIKVIKLKNKRELDGFPLNAGPS